MKLFTNSSVKWAFVLSITYLFTLAIFSPNSHLASIEGIPFLLGITYAMAGFVRLNKA